MKRATKIVLFVLVIGLAVVLASSFCGGQPVADAAGNYQLHIINNPLDVSLYQYSTDGTTFADGVLPLTSFVNDYYAALPSDAQVDLFVGSVSSQFVTAQTITVSKDTTARLYLDNNYASTVPSDAYNREVTIATNDAIILAGQANLTIISGRITTDGSVAIAQRSTGTLAVQGGVNETVIHSQNLARPTYGGTIFIDSLQSAHPSYIQSGGTITNSAVSPYTAAIFSNSSRSIHILDGRVVSTPAATPTDNFGLGEAMAIHSISDGTINISGSGTLIATANALAYYNGTIKLSGAATGKTTLNITGGSIINNNTNLTYAQRCNTIFVTNPNKISISGAHIYNACGYAIHNSSNQDVAISNSSTISNHSAVAHDISAIYMAGGNLSVSHSEVASSAPYKAAIDTPSSNVLISYSSISAASNAYGCLKLGGGDLVIEGSLLNNAYGTKIFIGKAANNIMLDNFQINGNPEVDVTISCDGALASYTSEFTVTAADNSGSSKYFRHWNNMGAHYSDSHSINAAMLPVAAVLSITAEDVYSFTGDPDITNGYLADQTPTKTFAGRTTALKFNAANAYYLYEAYYTDSLSQKVSLYLHNGSYAGSTTIDAIMPAGGAVVCADFRPIPLSVTLANLTAVFGGSNIRLQAVINSFSGVTYTYTWYHEGVQIAGQTNSWLPLANVGDSGQYSVTVTSSLGDVASDSASATINPLSVNAVWDTTTVFQYSGANMYPSAVALDLDGQPLTLIYSGASYMVGRHTLSIYTTNPNYTVANGQIQYDIIPLTTTLVWSNLSFVYDGSSHKPTASAQDVDGNPIEVVVVGGKSDASPTPYTAYASAQDGNYVFANDTQEFTIAPVVRVVSWSFQYTDAEHSQFFYNGYDQLMRIEAYFYNIYDYKTNLYVSVVGETDGATDFKKPDTYIATANFVQETPNYVLRTDATQLRMFKARPRITAAQSEFVFVHDLSAHSIVASVVYADSIVYLHNGTPIANSFAAPGIYEVTLTTAEDSLHDAAAEVYVTVIVLAVQAAQTDDESNSTATIYNGNGFYPDATLQCTFDGNITPQINSKYVDFWGRSVHTIINISLTSGGSEVEVQGSSVVRILLSDEILANRVIKLRRLQGNKRLEVAYTIDENGYMQFESSTLGEYAIVGESSANAIIGVAASIGIGIAIIVVAVISLVARRRRVY